LNWSRIKACLLIVGKKLNLCSAAKIIHSLQKEKQNDKKMKIK